MRILAVLALAGLATSAHADARGPFDACVITAAPKPDDRSILCTDFKAFVSEGKPGFGADAVLETIANALTARPGVRVERAPVTVAGTARPGLRYQELRGSVTALRGTFAAVPVAGDRFRLVGCESATEVRCDGVLAALATTVPSANRDSQPTDDTLAGRAVRVPPGCRMTQPRKLSCPGGGVLTWNALGADEPAGFEWLWAPLKQAMTKQGVVTERRQKCALDGVTTECRLLDIARTDGAHWSVVGALAEVRGVRVFVQCNAQQPPIGRFAAPCDEVLAPR